MVNLANAELGSESLTPAARRSIVGGIISMFVDTYDVYLPALVLPAAMTYFEPDWLSTELKVTLTTLIFTVALLGRPLGSLLFGNLSDKFGRKRTTMIAAVGYTILTFIMAIMPGYAKWGYAAIGILIFLRLVVGMFLAGGYAAPIPLALERSPTHLRGLVAGLVAAGAPAAVFVINLIQLIVLSRVPTPAFVAWGWRIPFFFGVALGIAYLVYYSRVPELDRVYLVRDHSVPRQPLLELFTGANLKSFGQVFLLTSGYWFAAQMVVSYLPSFLIGVLHQFPSNVSTMFVWNSPLGIVFMILFGVLAQKVGRRRLLIWLGFWTTLLTPLIFYFMIQMSNGKFGFLPIAVMATLANILTSGPLGVLTVYLNERFPVRIRSTGYSVAYTFGLILPGLYSFWLLWLSRLVPYQYTELILVAFGGVLVLCGAWLGPETRDVEMLDQAAGN
jgi:MFS family permease